MMKIDDRPGVATGLRNRTDERVREKAVRSPENSEALSLEETRRLLHELRVHYFDLYDLAPVGYCILSEKGLILEANLTAATLLGVARGALVRRPLTRFILAEDQDIYYLHRNALFETGASQVFELRMLRPDSPQFWARLEASVVRNSEDGPLVCRVVMSDITDRKLLEVEKAKLEIQYRQIQKAESLGRMAGAIAHHYNNLLSIVMGNLELAMCALPLGSGIGKNLTGAMQAACRAAEVSGLMLTYLGQTPGKQEPLDLSETCRRSLPMLHAVMPKDMDIEADLPSPGPTINANAHQIQQILTHLATNAWEAIGEARGAIRLTVRTVFPAGIPVTHRFPLDWQPQDDLYACMEVTDDGCGIAEKDIEKLFDPFFTSKFTGRGLGLPVVLGVVRAHSGAVTVESEAGRGSVFRVFLPVSTEAVIRQPEKTAQVPIIEEGGTVLLVEDEHAVREMAKVMLTHIGFTVLEAKDGIEAIEVFRQYRDTIRCVLCDLTMPRMDGWETLGSLRKLAPGIPVILSSGYDQAHVMAGDHPEWPQAFLGKPYNLMGLGDAIRKALENK